MASIYLAGKIAKNDWRHKLIPDLYRGGQAGSDDWTGRTDATWPYVPGVVHGWDYAGPFFTSCDHGCSHGPSTHGNGETQCGSTNECDLNKARLYLLCYTAISRAGWFFAWIDDHTAYGTLVELGIARGFGKAIIIASPTGFDLTNLWFAQETADIRITAEGPLQALEQLRDRVITKEIAQRRAHDQINLLESPLEHDFWAAYTKTMPVELVGLVPQHKVTAGGKNYRLDFAIPLKKIAFEMDGKTYHDTDKAFVNDRRRDLNLELAGWRVHRFDGDLIRTNPAAVVAWAVQLAGLIR
jgi:very-short-patch-repair endonuclease